MAEEEENIDPIQAAVDAVQGLSQEQKENLYEAIKKRENEIKDLETLTTSDVALIAYYASSVFEETDVELLFKFNPEEIEALKENKRKMIRLMSHCIDVAYDIVFPGKE
jgi:uncharacterized protein YjgD (DUF1641 family)